MITLEQLDAAYKDALSTQSLCKEAYSHAYTAMHKASEGIDKANAAADKIAALIQHLDKEPK